MLSLSGDESFLDLFPGTNPRMPDLEVGWSSINCWIGTIQNTIPFNSVLWSLFRAPAYGSRNSLDSSPVGSGRDGSSSRCPRYRPDSDPHR